MSACIALGAVRQCSPPPHRRAPAPTLPTPPADPVGHPRPGGIANSFADAVPTARLQRSSLSARARAERAEEFAARHGIQRAHGSYADLVADPDVDAVYVASPHSAHHEHALLALRAANQCSSRRPSPAACARPRRSSRRRGPDGLLAAEAMWSSYLPHYDVVRRTVDAGTLGEVVLVEADHGQRLWPDGPARLSQPELAGGALLDLGVYPSRSPTTCSAASPTSRPEGCSPTSASTRRRRSTPAAPRWRWPALVLDGRRDGVPRARRRHRARLELEGRFYDVGSRCGSSARTRACSTSSCRDVATTASATRPPRSPGHWRQAGTRHWSMPWDATRRVMARHGRGAPPGGGRLPRRVNGDRQPVRAARKTDSRSSGRLAV